MDTGDVKAWADLAGAFKAAIDAVRSLVDLRRSLRDAGRTSPEDEAKVDRALDHAEESLQLATANIAKALGYELCRCTFPPTPMLTVGFELMGKRTGLPVHECPRCRRNTAAPFDFHRTEAIPGRD